MKIISFPSVLSVLGAASWILLPAFDAAGQTSVSTNPVGFLQTPCLSNSDTLVAPPFTRPAAFTGAVSSISGATITLSSASLTADAYDAPATTPATKDTYYLSIGPTTATLTGTLTVTQGSTAVTGSGTNFGNDVKAGDRITINDGYNLLTYTVAAVGSTTSLTLDRAFTDSAAPSGTTPAASSAKAAPAKTTTAVSPAKAAAVKTTTVQTVSANSGTVASGTSLGGLTATFDHSPYEGRFYQVVSNTANSVVVNLNNDVLTSIAAGTQVSVIPYWTLNSVFPSSSAGTSFVTTTSTRQTNNTQVFSPNYAGSGINLGTSATYLYYSNGSNVGWRNVNDLATDVGYDLIQPDGYVTLRNPSASNLTVTFSGSVPINKLVTTLATIKTGPQDNPVALNRPADTTVGALGLNPADGSFVATFSTRTPGDELFVYNNSLAAFNKPPSVTYLYYNGGWRDVNDLSTDRGADVVAAGSALVVRKAQTTTAQTAIWTNNPNY